MNHIYEFVVLGAGISGLTLADRLSKITKNFLVVEKSRGVGGRLATRRDGENLYDHGAQFYKISSKHELGFDHFWKSSGVVKDWFSLNGVEHRISPQGMTGLAKQLAHDKSVSLNQEITHLKIENDLVILTCADQSEIKCQKLFITAPIPQAVILLERSGILAPEKMKDVKYAQALVGLFELENALELLPYQEKISGTIFSISRQDSKFNKNSPTLTVTMTPELSQTHFSGTDENNLKMIEDHLKEYLKKDFFILKSQLKKWRYSHPINPLKCGYLRLNSQMILLGDGFFGGSVNQAAKSALSIPLD